MGDLSDLMIGKLCSDEENSKEKINMSHVKEMSNSLADTEKQKEFNNNLLKEHFEEMEKSKICNTGVKAKRENWSKFAKFIENQFNHGGSKYSLPGQPDKEMTDLLCEMSPGKTGIDWIMQTISKYCGRYINFEREKDLFKIATFAYIAWLKKGYYLNDEHDEDTKK